MTLEAVAQNYLAQGFSVIPVKGKHGKDIDDAKKPLIPWEEFQHRKATPDEVSQWFKQWPRADIAIVTGPISDLFIIDLDGEEWRKSVADKEFPMTWTARTTRGGFHYYCRWSPRLAEYVTNRARILPGVDVRGAGGYAVAPPSQGFNGIPYGWIDGRSPQDCERSAVPDWIYSNLTNKDRATGSNNGGGTASKTPISEILEGVTKGQRNESLTRLAGFYLRLGMTQNQTLDHLRLVNQKCAPPLPEDEIQTIVQSVGRYATNSTNLTNSGSGDSYNSYFSYSYRESLLPAALSKDAFHGLLGQIVKTLDPYTEADPAAVLSNLLVMVGNVVGSRPHFKVNGDMHGLKIFMVHVGMTGKGRKGSSIGQPKRLIEYNDPKWVEKRIQSGLSSGEGLIWTVHDPVYQKQPIKDKKTGRITDYQRVMIHEGVEDKRTLIIEEEFSRTLKAMSRDGNTLSAVIRQAWDGGHLQTLTKGEPYEANGAHVSIIAHITKDELLRHFDSTEAANGFGNRFLWIVVYRSKLLPKGKSPALDVLQPLQTELSRRINFASTLEEITRTDEAETYWEGVYSALSEEKPGLSDAMTARAAPQVMRLACIYAILDQSAQVEVVHLKAALSIWQRVEDSIRFIFGQRLGDPIADEILSVLRTDGPKTLTQIHGIFKRNQSADRIRTALALLSRYRLATPEKNESGAEVWVYIDPINSIPPGNAGQDDSA
jgi:hypothetical protein